MLEVATAADRNRHLDVCYAREKTAVRTIGTYYIAIIRTRTRRHESTRSRCTNSGLARASVLSYNINIYCNIIIVVVILLQTVVVSQSNYC